ncbi:hypothetical protein AMTRI_Chr12g267970 [Amborella trichopoda]
MKGGKFGKIKGMLKRWQSLGRMSRSGSSISSMPRNVMVSDSGEGMAGNYREVYVGKSRRRLLVSHEVLNHPVVRELVGEPEVDGGVPVVGCELVLFEHLLWILENSDHSPESLDELVDLYAC